MFLNKEELLKIQKCVLKVNIHCDGCKHKVKKILQKIDGVFTTEIDAEQGKVTVTGNVDAAVLIKKLSKSGKHAEIWGGQPANNKQNQQNNMAYQMKNVPIDNAKGGNKGQNQKGGGGNGNNQPKGGQVQGLQQSQLQQLQAMKGFQDLNLPPQLKGLKSPVKDQNPNLPKAGKFNLHEGDDLSDEDDLDEYDDEDDFDDDDELDDDLGNLHLRPANKMKPMMGNGAIPKMMMNGAPAGGNGGGIGKKGGGVVPPVQGNNLTKNGNVGGGKGNGSGGVGGGGSNQKPGGGSNQKPGTGGGGEKNNGGGGGGGGNNKNAPGGGNGSSNGVNGGQKVAGGATGMGHDIQSLVGAQGLGMSNFSQMGNMGVQMGQMGDRPMGQMGSLSAVQGLPATAQGPAMTAGVGGGVGGFLPEGMTMNTYQQPQQYMTQMMNQQQHHALGHQPMMYARPPPAINYAPVPYPYPPSYHQYPYPPPQPEPYTYFSDENPSSCNIM